MARYEIRSISGHLIDVMDVPLSTAFAAAWRYSYDRDAVVRLSRILN